MTVIIDRRDEPVRHKFGKDQARFLNRIRGAIRKAVQDKVTESSIRNFEKGGVKIPIPRKTTEEPIIHHDQGPIFKKVFPGNLYNFQDLYASHKVFAGNDRYDVGDVVPVPRGGGGGGSGNGKEAGDGDDSEDDFVWLAEDEFLDLFFEGRSLPDMVKLHDEANTIIEKQRAGLITKGPSHKMDMEITNAKRRSEAIVLNRSSERRLLENLAEQYAIYRSYKPDLPELDLKGKSKSEKLEEITAALSTLSAQFTMSAAREYKNPTLTKMFNCVDILENNLSAEVTKEEDLHRLEVLRERIPEQKKTAEDAGKFQDHHLTYHFHDDRRKPAAKAVMFCKMDVSASMSQEDKNTAKAFFWILHKFLKSNYEQVITHTTTAEEVNEEEFFYGTRTGGTLVSSCLEEELKIIKERYPVGEWNIYSAQASDGDNMGNDNALVEKLLHDVLPMQQASYFIEIDQPWRGGGFGGIGGSVWNRGGSQQSQISELHKVYKKVGEEFPHLKTASISSPADALEAFKAFFPVGAEPAPTKKPALG